MKTQSKSLPQASNSQLSDEARQAACLVIVRFRSALDATLSMSEWQNDIRVAVESLRLPSQRQGISFVQAVLALPLESKRDVVNRLFESHSARLKRRSALALIHAWGIIDKPSSGAELTLSQWRDLRRGLTLRLASHYRSYKNAQNLLYQSYDYIAAQAAKEICRNSSRMDDCEQEGALGLLQAIDRIEPDRPFASYAFQWTKRRIRNYLMKNSLPISAPINLISKASRSKNTDKKKSLDTRTLALALNCLQQPYLEFSDELMDPFSSPIELETEILSPIAAAVRADWVEILEKALSQLSSKQREVLAFRFGVLNQEVVGTLQGIARATGISRQQVARREKRALTKLESLFTPLIKELA